MRWQASTANWGCCCGRLGALGRAGPGWRGLRKDVQPRGQVREGGGALVDQGGGPRVQPSAAREQSGMGPRG
eukprot:8722555-Pyramimonas_sp.AAC.1